MEAAEVDVHGVGVIPHRTDVGHGRVEQRLLALERAALLFGQGAGVREGVRLFVCVFV